MAGREGKGKREGDSEMTATEETRKRGSGCRDARERVRGRELGIKSKRECWEGG